MKTVDELMQEAFDTPRDPRSKEYKEGVRALLDWRVSGIRVKSPYQMGTVHADAFYSGCDEGHRIADRAGYPHRSKLIA
jgi:hypothetical protein